MQLTQSTPLTLSVKGSFNYIIFTLCMSCTVNLVNSQKAVLKNALGPIWMEGGSMNPCYVQLNFFAGCIMHVTYSYQHFSAFQMSILLLQFELNLNSFLYFNKNLQS